MNPALHVAGWTLIHFVWQGAAISLTAALVLRTLRQVSAQARYVTGCAALAAMLAAPLLTAQALSAAHGGPGASGAREAVVRVEFTRIVTMRGAAGDAPAADLERAPAGPALNPALPAMVFAWLSGVVLLILRLGGGWWHACRLQRQARAFAESRWQAASQVVAARLGIARRVHVVDGDLFDTPTLIGWLSPVIVLPIAALAHLTPAQVEAILAHELAHVRRHDYLVNLLQTVAETLLFYHPGVWWLSRRIRVEREHCCDDLAVSLCGDAVGYAAALAELETFRSAPPVLVLAVTGGSLVDRVRRVLGQPRTQPRPSGAVALVTLVLLMIVAGGAVQYIAAARSEPGGQTEPREAQRIERRILWRQTPTDHFNVLTPPELEGRAAQIGEQAERAYLKVSEALRHDLPARANLLLVDTDAALRRLVASGLIPPAAGGTILLALDGADRTLDATLVHEVTHSFTADILGDLGSPLWVREGLAEHMHGQWSPLQRGHVLQMLGSRTLPSIELLSRTSDNPDHIYAVGHAAFDFIDARWGAAGIRDMIAALRATSGDATVALELALRIDAAAFDREFDAHLRATMAPPPPPPPPPLPPPGAQASREAISAGRGGPRRFSFAADRITATNSTLRDLIRFAYALEEHELTGGPAWIATDTFDVETAGDSDGSHYGSPSLRALLERRFGVRLHEGSVNVPVYALTSVAGNGQAPELKPSTADCAAAAHPSVRGRGCGLTWMEMGRASGHGVTMAMLAQRLARSPRIDRTVVDRTGMTQRFDFILDFSPEPVALLSRAVEWAGVRPSLEDALKDQLGLELVEDTAPLSIFIVDRAQRPERTDP